MLEENPDLHQLRHDLEKQIRDTLTLLGMENDDDDDDEWLAAQLTNANEWEWYEEL